MAEEEAEVEGRVAAWAHSKSSRINPPAMDQDVLGAEVAQDERALVSADVHRGDQVLDPRSEVGMGPGGRAVVGIDPQLVEERCVGQGLGAEPGVRGASAWMVPRMRAQPRGDLADRPGRPSGDDFQVTESSGAQVIANR